uniref:Uncharacterized protein n=1 Tax=Romanomermis culicivorax TaxID=13658 RepID=A0A915K9T1_ROMCU
MEMEVKTCYQNNAQEPFEIRIPPIKTILCVGIKGGFPFKNFRRMYTNYVLENLSSGGVAVPAPAPATVFSQMSALYCPCDLSSRRSIRQCFPRTKRNRPKMRKFNLTKCTKRLQKKGTIKSRDRATSFYAVAKTYTFSSVDDYWAVSYGISSI